MSALYFLNSPFPDNHDGFDYSPKSFSDVQREHDKMVADAQSAKQQNKLLSMFASIFK